MGFMERFTSRDDAEKQHRDGTIATEVLVRIEQLVPAQMSRTAETGCGKSTVFFSNVSQHHTVFAYDDRDYGDQSSVNYYENHPLTRREAIHAVFGPTQQT